MTFASQKNVAFAARNMAYVGASARRESLSLLVGEMAGRPEGGDPKHKAI
jgi:hypothetical protein